MAVAEGASSTAPVQRSCLSRALPWGGAFYGAGTILFGWLFGILFVFDSSQPLLHAVVNSQAPTSTGQKFFDAWSDHGSAADITMYYWLWDVKNPAAAMNLSSAGLDTGAKPVVEPIGPFAYTQRNYKDNIVFHDDGKKVSFKYNIAFEFDKERSGAGLSEDTQVHMPNLPLMGAYWRTSHAAPGTASAALAPLCLNWASNDPWRQREIVNYTAREWLWGMEDPLVVQLENTLKLLILMGQDTRIRLQPALQQCADVQGTAQAGGKEWNLCNDTVCWQQMHTIALQFNMSNDYGNHTSTQWTGKDDVAKAGQMVEWEGCPTIGWPGNCTKANQFWGITPAIGGGEWGIGGPVGDCARFGTAAECGADAVKLYCEWDASPAAGGGCRATADVVNAGRVYGTDGFQQRPDMAKLNGKTDIFIDQTWRKWRAERTGGCDVKGIKDSCSRWVLSDDNWLNPEGSHGANAGYLPSPPGLVNFTTVQAAPIYLSQPYFKGAAAAEGMVDMLPVPGCGDAGGADTGGAGRYHGAGCVGKDMESSFLYEEWTGLGLAADVGIQINIRVRDVTEEWNDLCGDDCQQCGGAPETVDKKKFTKGMREAYYPMVTIRQVVTVHQSIVDRLNKDVLGLIKAAKISAMVILPLFNVVGIAILALSVRTILRRRRAAADAEYSQLQHGRRESRCSTQAEDGHKIRA